MKNSITPAIALVVLLLSWTASASVNPAQKADSTDPVAQATELVQQAFNEFQHSETAAGKADLAKAIASAGFPGLPADLRYRVLLLASIVANEDGQYQQAHDDAVRATAFDAADDTAWLTRLSAAFATKDFRDAGHSLTVYAQRWPDKLDALLPIAIMQLQQQLQLAQDDDVDRGMLDALFDANWRNSGVEPSMLWKQLALLHIQHGDIARATTVAMRIDSGQVAIAMRVDKRFDPITLAHPQAFDVDQLVAAEIAAAKARIAAHPDQLSPVTDLQELYLLTRQPERVLSISDAAVAHASQGDGAKTFTDFADRFIWVLDNRARAYAQMGRWDDAVRTEVLAARHPEQGAMNVSQLINLGDLHANLGQPDKAAEAIVELGDMSPYGRMQLEFVRLKIAIEKKDDIAIAAAMKTMREQRSDAVGTWERALLLRGQLDDAAALLIERLQNADWRNAALVDMQHYAETTVTPVEKTIQDNWNLVTARPDVQAALQKVGRVERFNITASLL